MSGCDSKGVVDEMQDLLTMNVQALGVFSMESLSLVCIHLLFLTPLSPFRLF